MGGYFYENTCALTVNASIDCYDICRFLTYARILDPASKYATWDQMGTYYEKPDFSYHHIMRFLDLIEDNHDEGNCNIFT